MRKSSYKDLDKFRKTKARQKRRYYGKTKGAPNRGKLWTQKEVDMVMEKEHKMTDTELSALIGRSVGSIQVKRCQLKKMDS